MNFLDLGISKRLFSTKTLAVVAALGLTVGTAAAATFDSGTTYTVTNQSGTNNPFKDSAGQHAWYKYVDITSRGTEEYGDAGLFRMTATNKASGAAQDFLAFCMSPWQYMRSPPNDYKTDPSLGLSTAQLGWVGALVHNAWGSISNSTSAAAFQIALWEIVSEKAFDPANPGTTTYSLYSGDFILNNLFGTQARSDAENLLANITGGKWFQQTTGFTLLHYTDPSKPTQDLLTVAPVPLPATGLLLLGGFGLLAGVKRRKRAA